MSNKKYPTDNPAVVTCGLPYANGDLHIGHLRGYVSADVLNRALNRIGQQSIYACGSDMHGAPIAVTAQQEGVDPEAFALEYHEQYQETFPQFDIDFDNYGHTHDETNTELTREIVRSLEDEGYIREQEIEVAWDPEDDQALPDRYVEGTCPYCGEQARGDECDEGCGRHLEPGEVEAPVSTISGNKAEYRTRTHKFFAVSELADYLTAFLDDLEGTANATNQPRQWIEEGLQDWCITRDLDWGIDYPGDDDTAEELVLYVWVDAPIEYIASTKQYTERVGADEYDWEDVWKAAEEPADAGEIIHVIGRDIIQHHTIFWPAMLHVAGYNAPRSICATGFITIDGKGLSTSRNRAIWAQEYLDEGFETDLLRFYLTTNGGFQQDLDFSWNKFQNRINGELVDTLGNFCYRSLLFAYRNYEGTPEADVSEEVTERIEAAITDFEDAVNDYSVRAVGEVPIELARFGNEYIQRNEPWKLVDEEPDKARQVIRDCVQLAKAIAVLAEPVQPNTAAKLWAQVGGTTDIGEVTVEAALAEPAQTFDEPTELFGKLEDDRIEALEDELAEKIAETTAEDDDTADDSTETMDLEPIDDDRISFEEFKDVDLRVGRIEKAEGIDGADELVRLDVDIGVETRQIVAGLKQLHEVDHLPGTKVVVVANLEQAELFGTESNGMVLAAGEQADLLTTHEDAEPGTKVL